MYVAMLPQRIYTYTLLGLHSLLGVGKAMQSIGNLPGLRFRARIQILPKTSSKKSLGPKSKTTYESDFAKFFESKGGQKRTNIYAEF